MLQSRPLRHTLLKAPRKLATQLRAFDASRRLPRKSCSSRGPSSRRNGSRQPRDGRSPRAAPRFAWLSSCGSASTKIVEEEVQSKTREQYDDRVEWKAVTGLGVDVESLEDDERTL